VVRKPRNSFQFVRRALDVRTTPYLAIRADPQIDVTLDFIARLAALVPRPRVNLARFHGVFAPNSRYRAQITPAGRGRQGKADPNRTEPKKRRAMTWAQRLKRVFRIDIGTCESCGGAVRVIACIDDPLVIEKILTHIERRPAAGASPHAPRAPPAMSGGEPQ